jgi:1,4-dihydroxy-2-naphthoate octaprenyltransferase
MTIAVAEGFRSTVRSGEWWDYKLVPILSGFYATMLLLGEPLAGRWQSLLLLLLSLLPGAAYVSIVNDLTDLRDDAAAGKANRMAGRSRAFRAAALLATLAGGALFFWLWRGQVLLLCLYGAAWIAFTLYSVPPFRLKARGLAGLVADASGAHLFPTLLAAALPFAAAGAAPDWSWLAAIGAWSLAYGLRGNLWHQLLDRDRDRAAGVGTFAALHPRSTAIRLGAGFIFPAEVAALAWIFWRLQNPLPPLAFAFHLLLAARRVQLWHMRVVVTEPKGDYFILLHEYYDVLLPLALLGASALRHPADLVVLAIHLLLFHRRPVETWRDGWKLVVIPLLQRLRIVDRPQADGG